jgi:hypothetical protein
VADAKQRIESSGGSRGGVRQDEQVYEKQNFVGQKLSRGLSLMPIERPLLPLARDLLGDTVTGPARQKGGQKESFPPFYYMYPFPFLPPWGGI